MKVLALEQPWAQLVCSGICDVVAVDKYFDYRGEVFVVALDPIYHQKLPYYEWVTDILNNITYGNIPDEFSWESLCYIGKIDFEDCISDCTSLWQQELAPTEKYMRVKNARLLHNPVQTERFATPGIYNVRDNKSLLTAETYTQTLRYPYIYQNKIIIPVSEEVLNNITSGEVNTVNLFLSEEIVYSNWFIDYPDCEMVNVTSVELKTLTQSMIFNVESVNLYEAYDKQTGKEMSYKSRYSDELFICEYLAYEVGRPIMWI